MEGNRLLLTEDTLFWAFRYALGRRTYAVSMVVDEVLGVWDEITLRTQEQIVREILQEEARDRTMESLKPEGIIYPSCLGHDMDKTEWFKIVAKFKEESPNEYGEIKSTLR